jgi:hypothetical protein
VFESNNNGRVTQVSSCALDGLVVIWDLNVNFLIFLKFLTFFKFFEISILGTGEAV